MEMKVCKKGRLYVEPQGEFPQTKEEWVKILASRIPDKKKFAEAKKHLNATWEQFKAML